MFGTVSNRLTISVATEILLFQPDVRQLINYADDEEYQDKLMNTIGYRGQ